MTYATIKESLELKEMLKLVQHEKKLSEMTIEELEESFKLHKAIAAKCKDMLGSITKETIQ